MSWTIEGRTVLITGAARGIGAATAERLHARGANLALVGLEPEQLEALADRLGDRAAAFEADVTDPDALERGGRGRGRRASAASTSRSPTPACTSPARSSTRPPSSSTACSTSTSTASCTRSAPARRT